MSTAPPTSLAPTRPPLAPWQRALREAIRDPDELCKLLELPATLATEARRVMGDFPLFVTREYVARMRPGDPDDPLLRQVLPQKNESQILANFTPDPVGDAAAARLPGFLQKYAGRVLLITTGACAVHCRYCFRRAYPYETAPKTLAAWEPALAAIAADPTIAEVILSGGDPLTLRDGLLGELAARLAEIPHLRRLRVHTRLPIFIPSRVDDALLGWLKGTRLSPIVVVHANHSQEIDTEVGAALRRLVDAGIPTLNQTVLLRGINDNVDTLAALSERLLDDGVMPYYLHQLDRVAGAAHFEVDEARGRAIIDELRLRLPGYAVPRYVREIEGEGSKTAL